ncbi:TraB/GumN family protein [Undibacterium sp. FT147W]|uniref:TraB/GumN family protein n=1 Tax=Undibacterium rivi TaxID=2828729 RepID=A0ABS5GXB3_9BURK|nr:TraB/GumN family protein [Undibacterium rivi]MBR7791099.1 TraB/GumN family protein [Undibacterium rivi]
MSLFHLPHPLLKRVIGVLAGAAVALHGLAQAADDTPANGIMWEVKSATNTAYLFGSFHLAKASFYPLPAAVQSAYQQADTVAVEVDASDPQFSRKMMPLLSYTAPDKLENHVQKATWESMQKLLGASAAQFQSLKPAMVATGLMIGIVAQQGYDPAQGVDLHFIKRAKKDGKQLVELESLEFQARMLGGLSDEDGDAMLSMTLQSLSNGDAVRDTAQMVQAWKAGDAEALATMLEETANKDAGSRKLMKLLLDDRNPAMAEQIVALMNAGKKVMIVVGAGHVTGKNSITDLLRQRGLQVRQMKPETGVSTVSSATTAPKK